MSEAEPISSHEKTKRRGTAISIILGIGLLLFGASAGAWGVYQYMQTQLRQELALHDIKAQIATITSDSGLEEREKVQELVHRYLASAGPRYADEVRAFWRSRLDRLDRAAFTEIAAIIDSLKAESSFEEREIVRAHVDQYSEQVSTAVASRIQEHFESRIEELEEEAFSEILNAVRMLNAGSSEEQEAELKARVESYIEGASRRHKAEIEEEWQDRVAAIERERTDIERITTSFEDLRSEITSLPALPSSRVLMHLENRIADFSAEAPAEYQAEIIDLWETETNRIESTRITKEQEIRNSVVEFSAKLTDLEREVEAIERKRSDLQQEELDAGLLMDADKVDWARERLDLWKSYQDWFVEFTDSLLLRTSIRQIEEQLIEGDLAIADQNVDETRNTLREIDKTIHYGVLSRYQVPLVSYALDRYPSDSGKTLQWTKEKAPGAVSAVIALYRDSVSNLEDKGIAERLRILETGQTAKGIEPAPESQLGKEESDTMVASNGTTAGAIPHYVAAGAPSGGSVALKPDDSSRPLDPQPEAAKAPPAVAETLRQGQGDAPSPRSDESVKAAQTSPLTRGSDEQVELTEPPADKVYSLRELDRMIRPTRTSQPVLPFSRRRQPAAAEKVTVKFIVDEKGIPIEVSVVTSTDSKLDKPVLDAARKFRFEKPTKDGKPVKTSFHLPFNFGAK